MTRRAALAPLGLDPLASVRGTLTAMAARPDLPPLVGLAPDLTAPPGDGWVPAAALVDGTALPDFLDAAQQRWRASPHAAAALAWKCYTYWLALPAVLGYAVARRMPLVRPEAVVARWSRRSPFVAIGLTRVEVAVMSSDPLAITAGGAGHGGTAGPGVRVVPHDAAMLTELRASLVDEHLSPLLERIRDRVNLGHRTLWGSLASGVAYAMSRAADYIPAPVLPTTYEILKTLGVDDLVEITPDPDGRPGLQIQRRTCCLAFTVPEPKICSGCCIR